MRSLGFVLISLLAGLAATTAPVAIAQAPASSGSGGPRSLIAVAPIPTAPAPVPTDSTFRASTEMVALNVTVTDAHDHFVTGLSKDDFAVLEDGVPQDVTFFATTDVPLDLAIMIDTSASMADKMSFVHQAAVGFVRTLRARDRAEIIGFSSDTQVLVPFTSDKSKLEDAVNATSPHGSTALYNSVYVAIEDMSRLARRESDIRRPAIVVLTDGDDTSSLMSADDVLDSVKRSNVAVYTISIVSKTDTRRFEDGHRYINEADFSLKSLAQETGGRSFFPLELKDLDGTYQQIARELTSQYSLAYAPRTHGDGAFHRLFVRVLHRDDVRSRTRTGYYATRPLQASLGRE